MRILLLAALVLAGCSQQQTADPAARRARMMDAIILSNTLNQPQTPEPQPLFQPPTPTQPAFVTVGNRTLMCQQIAPGQTTCF